MNSISNRSTEALVVLGGGIDPTGKLSSVSAARLAYALKLCEKHPVPIIFSGRWSLLADTTPPISEAAAMRTHALERHIPGSDLLIEDEAMETIGNAYFSDKRFLAPRGWRQICVITSAFHKDRAAYTFRKALGDSVRFKILAAPDRLPPTELSQIKARERIILAFTKHLLDTVAAGDRTAIHAALQKLPGYNTKPVYTKKEIIELLNGTADLGGTYGIHQNESA